MRIALVNVTKPESGTGDGVTEYTYRLYEKLRRIKGNKVSLFYSIKETKRNNIRGLLYTQTLFRHKLKPLLEGNYDIIHITNQEVGFVARAVKNSNSKAKVVTTIHDTMRLRSELHKGLMQKSYNVFVSRSIHDAIKFSEFIIFYESGTEENIKKLCRIKNYANIPLGIKDDIIKTKIPKRKKHNRFVVGYLGSFMYSKNVIMILKAARLMLKDKQYQFKIYGTGAERDNLLKYKEDHDLDNVEFMGFAQESKKRQIYDSFDAFAWPALGTPHNFPPLEAMARGLPVIASKKGEYIKEIRANLLLANDEYDLVKTIRSIRENGYDKKFAKKATAYARSISWDETAGKTMSVYRRIIKDAD
jgi:glycosyltransferase involved in cell wall biosynthesis